MNRIWDEEMMMKYLRILLASAAMALLLFGCEGDEGGGGGAIPTPPSFVSQGQTINFNSFVRQLLASTFDTTEPVDSLNNINFSFTEDETAFSDLFL